MADETTVTNTNSGQEPMATTEAKKGKKTKIRKAPEGMMTTWVPIDSTPERNAQLQSWAKQNKERTGIGTIGDALAALFLPVIPWDVVEADAKVWDEAHPPLADKTPEQIQKAIQDQTSKIEKLRTLLAEKQKAGAASNEV